MILLGHRGLSSGERATHRALRPAADSWWASLPADQRLALLRYKALTGTRVNKMLRREHAGRGWHRAVADRVGAALASAPAWPQPVVVWRGEQHHTTGWHDPAAAVALLSEQWPEGSVLERSGFTSWSVAAKVAARFTNAPKRGVPLLLRTTMSGGAYLGFHGIQAEYDVVVAPSSWLVESISVAPSTWLSPRRARRGPGCVVVQVQRV